MFSFPISGICKIILMIFLATVLRFLPMVSAGICWYKMDSTGYCKETLKSQVSKEKCCNDGDVNTAWSSDDLQDDVFFMWRTLERGVPCKACQETCDNVVCGKNKKCIMKRGRPVCVCSPKCKYANYKKGPVCGTDNRSYPSACRLKKIRCRTKNPSLRVNYHGFCRTSCKNVKCKRGKYCVHDQYLNAHCIECDSLCHHFSSWHGTVCGDDGVTYQNRCHLESASCFTRKTITIAYQNACQSNATCATVTCLPGEKCLVHKNENSPRCVSCAPCSESKDTMAITICGDNNQTYNSSCAMIQDSCQRGTIIEAVTHGSCELKNSFDYSVLRKY